MRSAVFWFLVLTMLCVTPSFAKSEKQKAPTPAPATEQEKQILKRVAELQQKIWRHESRLNALEGNSATVSTEEQQYGLAKTPFGVFPIVCRNVTPFLDGYKVKLAIGNITSANFSGAKIKVSWSLPFPKDGKPEDIDRFIKSMKEKEFDVTNFFPSGEYTDVELSISPSTPEEM
jgi:hypothetical protein